MLEILWTIQKMNMSIVSTCKVCGGEEHLKNSLCGMCTEEKTGTNEKAKPFCIQKYMTMIQNQNLIRMLVMA
jgi:DnaJ-class molecular chaperone